MPLFQHLRNTVFLSSNSQTSVIQEYSAALFLMDFCFWRRRKGFVRISDKYIPKENSPLFLYQVLSLLPKAWLMLFYIRCLRVWSVDRKCAYLHFLSNCKVSAKYILKLVYRMWLMMKNFSVVSVKHCVTNDLDSLLTLPWARHFYISTVIINLYVVHTVMTSDDPLTLTFGLSSVHISIKSFGLWPKTCRNKKGKQPQQQTKKVQWSIKNYIISV